MTIRMVIMWYNEGMIHSSSRMMIQVKGLAQGGRYFIQGRRTGKGSFTG